MFGREQRYSNYNHYQPEEPIRQRSVTVYMDAGHLLYRVEPPHDDEGVPTTVWGQIAEYIDKCQKPEKCGDAIYHAWAYFKRNGAPTSIIHNNVIYMVEYMLPLSHVAKNDAKWW